MVQELLGSRTLKLARRWVVVFLCASATIFVGAPEDDPVLASCTDVVDVAVLADGTACLLGSQTGPIIVKPGDWKAISLAPVPGGRLTFLRVFAGLDDKTLLRLVAITPLTVPVVYAWRGGAWEKEGELPKPLPNPQEIHKLRCFQEKRRALDGGLHRHMRGD